MAFQSRRARIIEALVKQLKTISIANGYYTNVNEVSLDVKNWQDKPEAETPVLYVIDERTAPQYHAGRTLEVSWFFGIYGYMRNKSQYEMEEFIADIEKCLDNNRQLSFNGERGLVNHHRVIDITTDNQMFSEIEGSQLFKIGLEILYTRCVEDPR